MGSRMEADPRAEAASHPNAVFDWTQQTRHHCCVSQPSTRPGDLLVCIPSVAPQCALLKPVTALPVQLLRPL